MRLAPYIAILILLLLLIFGWIHYSNKTGKIEQKYLREKLDSAIKPHQQAIIKIEEKRKEAIKKLKTDLVKHLEESKASRKEISSLRRQLKAVKYTGDPSKVSDDSVRIAMQALKEAPVKDSIIGVQDKENDRLNSNIDQLQVDYSQILDLAQQESNQKDKIISDWKAHGERLEKENKRLRRKGIWNSVKIGAAALGVGFIIGLSQ